MLFPSLWKRFEADVSQDPSDLFNLKLDVAPMGNVLSGQPCRAGLWNLSSVLCNSAAWKADSLWVGTTAWVEGVAWEGCWCIQKRCWNQPQQVLGELFSFLVFCSFAAALPECCFCRQPDAGSQVFGSSICFGEVSFLFLPLLEIHSHVLPEPSVSHASWFFYISIFLSFFISLFRSGYFLLISLSPLPLYIIGVLLW